MKIKLLVLVFILGACSGSKNKSNTESKKLIGSIEGIWTDGSTENASFVIEKDTIDYFDQGVKVKYEIKDDSLMIFYPQNYTYKCKLEFHNDTLIFIQKESKTKVWKFKN